MMTLAHLIPLVLSSIHSAAAAAADFDSGTDDCESLGQGRPWRVEGRQGQY